MDEEDKKNTDPRKASEIILSLEEKVNTIIKIMSVYDMNMKITLDRVNKIYEKVNKVHKYIEDLEAENSQPEVFKNYEQLPIEKITQEPEAVIQTSIEHVITATDLPIVNKRSARSEPYSQESVQLDMEKKIPITQRVTDNTGKDLFMAEVSIFNENKDLILKTKTNAAGKWQGYLKSGNYTVGIVKTDTATKKKIEAFQQITVNNSNSTLTLPTAIIKR